MRRVLILAFVCALASAALAQDAQPDFSSIAGKTVYTCAETSSLFQPTQLDPKLDWGGDRMSRMTPFRAAKKTGAELLRAVLGDTLAPVAAPYSGFLAELPKGVGETVSAEPGITTATAECLMGRPDHKNKVGRIEQWSYFGGRLLVYFDSRDFRAFKVEHP